MNRKGLGATGMMRDAVGSTGDVSVTSTELGDRIYRERNIQRWGLVPPAQSSGSQARKGPLLNNDTRTSGSQPVEFIFPLGVVMLWRVEPKGTF